MRVEKKVRETETVISGPTREPDPDVIYEDGVTYEDGKKEKND